MRVERRKNGEEKYPEKKEDGGLKRKQRDSTDKESQGGRPNENLSPAKCESMEEAKEEREVQDVMGAGREFQRIIQEGRNEDKWEELEQAGTSNEDKFRRE